MPALSIYMYIVNEICQKLKFYSIKVIDIACLNILIRILQESKLLLDEFT